MTRPEYPLLEQRMAAVERQIDEIEALLHTFIMRGESPARLEILKLIKLQLEEGI